MNDISLVLFKALKKNSKSKQRRLMKDRKEHEGATSGGQWKCDACGNFYRDRRRLRKHYYSVHRELMPKPTCPVCSEVFETRKLLNLISGLSDGKQNRRDQ